MIEVEKDYQFKQTHLFTAISNRLDPLGFYQLAKLYLEGLKILLYAESTLEHREYYLLFFIDWACQRDLRRPSEITKLVLERYQRYVYYWRKKNGDPLSSREQYNRISIIRHWFRWLTQQNYLLYNPASELALPRIDKRLPRAILTADEVERIMRQPKLREPLGLRDRAILETFYSTGIRRSELLRLILDDVDVERGILVIRLGKGKKDRMVPISERALLWIERYSNEVRKELVITSHERTLFLSKLGTPIVKDRLTSMVRRYIKRAKINKAGSCHIFRHSMATLMLENGADVRFIQAILGHATLSTTQIYTQVSMKKLKEVHAATHPSELKKTKQEKNYENKKETEQKDSLNTNSINAYSSEENLTQNFLLEDDA